MVYSIQNTHGDDSVVMDIRQYQSTMSGPMGVSLPWTLLPDHHVWAHGSVTSMNTPTRPPWLGPWECHFHEHSYQTTMAGPMEVSLPWTLLSGHHVWAYGSVTSMNTPIRPPWLGPWECHISYCDLHNVEKRYKCDYRIQQESDQCTE